MKSVYRLLAASAILAVAATSAALVAAPLPLDDGFGAPSVAAPVPAKGGGSGGVLAVEPAALDFGTVGAPTTRTLVLRNTGDEQLRVTGFGTTSGAIAFNYVAPAARPGAPGESLCPDSPFPIEPGQSCAIRIDVGVDRTGPQAGFLIVFLERAQSPGFTVPLSALVGSGGPLLAADNDRIAFVAVPSGTIRFLSLRNAGTEPLRIDAFEGFGSPFFPVLASALGPSSCGDLPRTLQPAQSCLIGIEARSTTPGDFDATLRIVSNGLGSPLSIRLFASFAPEASPPSALADSTRLDFGTASPGALRAVTIRNGGGSTLRIDAIDGLAAPFRLASAAGASACGALPRALEPGQSCQVGIELGSASPGAYAATLQVRSNDPASPLSIALAASLQPGAAPAPPLVIPAANGTGLLLLAVVLAVLGALTLRQARRG